MASAQQSEDTKKREAAAWLEGVHNLIVALQGTAIDEVEIQYGDTAVYMRRRPGIVLQPPVADAPPRSEAPPSRAAIKAPLNGIYYDRPSPEAEPFVQVGDRIETGGVVAVIEAMKVFNEVHADRSGRVTALLVESGEMVESGQDLIALAGEDGGDAP